MKLTPDEEAYTRQVAADIGRDPADLIREGEQLKGGAYHEAALNSHQADTAAMERMAGAGGLDAYGGGQREWEREAGS